MLSIVTRLMLVALIPACFPDDDEAICVIDDDCADVCTRTGECTQASSLVEARITWTVWGQTPSLAMPQACDGIAYLSANFETWDGSEGVAFQPIPCALGLVHYDKMPARLRSFRLLAINAQDRVLAWGSRDLARGENTLAIDLRP